MSSESGIKVSIVIPLFNGEKHLTDALASIAASSHANIDVIVVDDCSTDGSLKIASEYARDDHRFRIFKNDANRGVSFSRNRGLAEVRGEFVVFIDSDDKISPDWIENLLCAAQAKNADIVIGKSYRLINNVVSDYNMKGISSAGQIDFKQIIFKDNCVVWNKLYLVDLVRRSGIRFETDICIGEDLAFNYGIMAFAKKIYYTDKGHYSYRIDNPESVINRSTASTKIESLSKVLYTILSYSKQPETTNKGALRKVAKDLLTEFSGQAEQKLDDALLMTINKIDHTLVFRVGFKRWRRLIRKFSLSGLGSK